MLANLNFNSIYNEAKDLRDWSIGLSKNQNPLLVATTFALGVLFVDRLGLTATINLLAVSMVVFSGKEIIEYVNAIQAKATEIFKIAKGTVVRLGSDQFDEDLGGNLGISD